MSSPSHSGKVTAVNNGKVTVEMHIVSACASCEAHSRCGFAESKDKIVEIDTRQWRDYAVGDNVRVIIQTSNGLRAVLIAYIIPAIILIGALVAFYSMHINEGITALLTLAVVALYGVFLYLIRQRLQQRFTFQLRKG